MDSASVRQYLDAGWPRDSLARIDEIITLINRIPLQSKEQAKELFAVMVNEMMTSDEADRWTPEQHQEEEKKQWEDDHPVELNSDDAEEQVNKCIYSRKNSKEDEKTETETEDDHPPPS